MLEKLAYAQNTYSLGNHPKKAATSLDNPKGLPVSYMVKCFFFLLDSHHILQCNHQNHSQGTMAETGCQGAGDAIILHAALEPQNQIALKIPEGKYPLWRYADETHYIPDASYLSYAGHLQCLKTSAGSNTPDENGC